MSVSRVLLVRHATSSETRRGAFPTASGAQPGAVGDPLDGAGRAAAADLGAHLPTPDRCLSSWALRSRETAEAAGLEPELDGDLAECDFASWAGRTPAEVGDDASVGAWYADPDAAPHGGERLLDVRRRAAAVLARTGDAGGTTVAFTHGGFVKAAVLEVLSLPSSSVWQIDVAPASITELHRTFGQWRVVRLNWTPLIRVPAGHPA